MPLDGMTGRARNVVIANNDFATKDGTVLTSPTSFVAGMGLSNILNDRLKMVCRTIGNSVILDLDMGYPVPISLIMLLGDNFMASARWRIRGARARSGAASDLGGYSFALADTVYDTRSILASGAARGAYSWTSTALDHDFTGGTLPAGASFSRASTATYFDYTGTMRTAASGEARFDYDPVTKTARGLLVEPAATNLLLRSAEFDNAAWQTTTGSISANQDTAPDGTLSADKWTSNNGATGYTIQSVNFTSGVSYTYSMYVKPAGRTSFLLLVQSNIFSDATQRLATFTLTGSGTVASVSGAGATAAIFQAANGYYRISVSFTAGVTVSSGVQNRSAENGDGTSGVLLWGAQLETGSVATSYIPTAGTTATRAADVPTMPTSALPSFNAAAGSLVVSYAMAVLPSGATQVVVQIDDGTFNNLIYVRRDPTTISALIGSGGVTSASFTAAPLPTAGAEVRTAVAWSVNDFAFCHAGGTVGADASGAVPVGVSTLRLGRDPSGAPINGWISRITYIASRVSNADLQTLTNPATSAATRATTLAVYAGTESIQPITLGAGSKTVYVDDQDMRFYAGVRVRLSIDSSNYMVGTVTSYDRPSRRLVVSIASVVGSGSAATVTISREAADLAVWPAVEPFGLTYWGDFRWGGQIDLLGEGYQPPGVHMPGLANGDGQPIYARYLKIEVQDSSLSWLDIGRLVVAAAYQPTINMAWDWRIGWTDPSQRERSRGGQLYVDGRKQWRVASLQLANVGRDELLSQVYELRRAVGVRKPFALILDPTDPANLHRLTIWGSIPDQTMDFSNPQFGDYRAALTVEEHS